MKFFEITITPTSAFGTSLKGDTLFGHFCWQVAHDPTLVESGLDAQLKRYGQTPFVVFSSAFPKIEHGGGRYILPRPLAAMLAPGLTDGLSRKDRLLQSKALKDRRWMVADSLDIIEPAKLACLTSEALAAAAVENQAEAKGLSSKVPKAANVVEVMAQPHNTINRSSGTTGTGGFAPYAKKNHYYLPGATLSVFLLLDEAVTDIDRVCIGLERIGRWGFGRDASTGMGRFTVNRQNELSLPSLEKANACYSLAPVVPQKNAYHKIYFTPFVRFGKHGDRLAVGKAPFKQPVVMAEEGAVFVPKNPGGHPPWMGSGVFGVSHAAPQTVVQGYAPWLPLKMEF